MRPAHVHDEKVEPIESKKLALSPFLRGSHVGSFSEISGRRDAAFRVCSDRATQRWEREKTCEERECGRRLGVQVSSHQNGA
jgi:hypothetical protein